MLKTLSTRNALKSGSDLWVLADLNASYWTKKIHWYLNFQIYKFKKAKKLSTQKLKNLKDDGFNFKNITAKSDLLLISSEKLLSNKKTLIVKFEDTRSWFSKAKVCFESLNRPSIRFFLPDKMTKDEVLNHWEDDSKLSIVPPMQNKLKQL